MTRSSTFLPNLLNCRRRWPKSPSTQKRVSQYEGRTTPRASHLLRANVSCSWPSRAPTSWLCPRLRLRLLDSSRRSCSNCRPPLTTVSTKLDIKSYNSLLPHYVYNFLIFGYLPLLVSLGNRCNKLLGCRLLFSVSLSNLKLSSKALM